jgi:hypothetical protein
MTAPQNKKTSVKTAAAAALDKDFFDKTHSNFGI